MFAYSYCVLRYIHDPSAGESTNVGVLLFAPDAGVVRFYYEGRHGHLSRFFNGFRSDDYRMFLAWVASAVEKLQHSMGQRKLRLFEIEEMPEDAEALARRLVPDQGLSFAFGTAQGGITRHLDATGEAIFAQMVTSQRPPGRATTRRDDRAVWDAYHASLSRCGVTPLLRPHVVETSEFEIPFERAFQNEKWHAVEAMSFDYQDASAIRERALRWRGYGEALAESETFSRLYLLLGAPGVESHRRDYERAKSTLSKMAVDVQIVEEAEAEAFARELADYMRAHGVLDALTEAAKAS